MASVSHNASPIHITARKTTTTLHPRAITRATRAAIDGSGGPAARASATTSNPIERTSLVRPFLFRDCGHRARPRASSNGAWSNETRPTYSTLTLQMSHRPGKSSSRCQTVLQRHRTKNRTHFVYSPKKERPSSEHSTERMDCLNDIFQ